MNEHDDVDKELEAFGEKIQEGIQDMLMFLSVAPEIPRPVDPASMGIDERTMEELSPQEKAKIREVLLQSIGLNESILEKARLREYTTSTSEGTTSTSEPIQVVVYQTDLADVYLQQLNFTDGEVRFMLGPDLNI